MRLRVAAAHDDHVFKNHARSCEYDRLFEEVAAQVLAQIDPPLFAERLYRLSGFGIKAVEKVHDAGKEAPPRAILPPGQSAHRLSAANEGIELPFQLAGGRIESHDLLGGREGIEGAAHDERVVLDAALLTGVEGPGHFQLPNVAAVDLGELRVVVPVRAAVVDGPAGV